LDQPVSEVETSRPAWARFGGPLAVLILISSSHSVIHAYSTLMPLVYPHALHDLHFSLTQLGFMVGLSNLSGGFLQLGAGALTRYIPRFGVIGAGAVLMAGSALITGTASNFPQFFGGNVARSVVTSTQHPLGNSLLADIYGRLRRGFAISGHVAGGNVGTVLLTPFAGLLIGAFGWRFPVLLLSVPAALAGFAILLSIRERRRPSRGTSVLADMVAGVQAVRDSRNLLLIFLASLIAAGGRGLGVVILVVPLYLNLQLHLKNSYVTLLYSILLVGSVIGPLLAGRASDRVGRRPVLLLAYGLSAVTTVGLLLSPHSVPWLAVALAAMGLAVYAESPLLQTFLADESPIASRDPIFSLYFAVAFGIGALWAAAIGAALSRLGFAPVFVIMAITYLLSAVCVLAMRESKSGFGTVPNNGLSQ
jgi:MFS family permease